MEWNRNVRFRNFGKDAGCCSHAEELGGPHSEACCGTHGCSKKRLDETN